MISVEEALAACLALAHPVSAEDVPLAEAVGRVLVSPVFAQRDQPPFAGSAMDGFALRDTDAVPGARLRVVGEAPAGRAWPGTLAPGEALRIFTGAPVPEGADRIVIQEDVTREGDIIVLGDSLDKGPHIRPAGCDFRKGQRLEAPRRLTPADIALCASMNAPVLQVSQRPDVALIATGDELVSPGETPGADQIIASNTYGLKAMIEAEGAHARLLPIARDRRESVAQVLTLARDADLIVTVGGASVGDHDLVGSVAAEMGLDRAFYKVAMRPGKPLMAGRIGQAALLGLPGNPVSAMVCGHIFLVPMLRAFLGLPAGERRRFRARLGQDLPANGPRAHYMRSDLMPGNDFPEITAYRSQDSSLLSVLSQANALLVRAPGDPARKAGDLVEYLPLTPLFA
ncbi:MAG: molybdopterin molybdotransferase MoeA [Roseicyclus sp.]